MVETLQVFRGDNDKHGNANKTPSHTIEGSFAWGSSGKGTARFSRQDERQESSTVTAQLLVPQTGDLKQRDRVQRANGEIYRVIGHAMWSEASPFGADPFLDEDKIYQVEGTV